jgi:hypothetical protein
MIYVDDAEKTRAHRQYCIFWVFRAPNCLNLRRGSSAEINREKLCKFFNKERARGHQNALQEKMGSFPLGIGDFF